MKMQKWTPYVRFVITLDYKSHKQEMNEFREMNKLDHRDL